MLRVITGGRNIGKTTYVNRLIEKLGRDYSPLGLVTEKVFASGEFVGYQLRNIATGGVHPFLNYRSRPGGMARESESVETIGPFTVVAGAVRFAEKAFMDPRLKVGDDPRGSKVLIILDEVGMAEVRGTLLRGVLDTFFEILRGDESVEGLLVVQGQALGALQEAFPQLLGASLMGIDPIVATDATGPIEVEYEGEFKGKFK